MSRQPRSRWISARAVTGTRTPAYRHPDPRKPSQPRTAPLTTPLWCRVLGCTPGLIRTSSNDVIVACPRCWNPLTDRTRLS